MTREAWPALPLAEWQDTYATLHMWTQIVGKIRLAQAPLVNHWWNVTLYVTPRGLTTEPVHEPEGVFTLALDLAGHELVYESPVQRISTALAPTTVAKFYENVMKILAKAGHKVRIHAAPNEVDPATPFAEDMLMRAYSRDSATRLLGALHGADRVFRLFRSAFLGKVSPVHFFWGSFDLAVTRFSGRPAPR